MTANTMTRRLSIFPLTGAVLFPGMQLPLHIFEPRYRALVGEALMRHADVTAALESLIGSG
jgi:Lon protease-like protein